MPCNRLFDISVGLLCSVLPELKKFFLAVPVAAFRLESNHYSLFFFPPPNKAALIVRLSIFQLHPGNCSLKSSLSMCCDLQALCCLSPFQLPAFLSTVFSILTHARPHLCWRVIHCPRPPFSAHCPLVTAFLQLMTRALHPGVLASLRILCFSPSGINILSLYDLRICCASQGTVLIGSLKCSSSHSKKLLFSTEGLPVFITITVKDIILQVKHDKYPQWFLNHIFMYLKITLTHTNTRNPHSSTDILD